MAAIAYPPVQQALDHIKALSADAETRRLAFVRERALHDEVSELRAEREKGRHEGRIEGRLEGSLGQTIGNHHHLARTPRAHRFRQLGAATVEFALTATLSFGLQFAIIEFGIAMYNKAVIVQATRAGARAAALYWKDPAGTSQEPYPSTAITAAVNKWRNFALSFTGTTPATTVCRYPAATAPTGLTGLDCPASSPVPASVDTDDMVIVQTSFPYSGPLTSALVAPLGFTLKSRIVMRVE